MSVCVVEFESVKKVSFALVSHSARKEFAANHLQSIGLLDAACGEERERGKQPECSSLSLWKLQLNKSIINSQSNQRTLGDQHRRSGQNSAKLQENDGHTISLLHPKSVKKLRFPNRTWSYFHQMCSQGTLLTRLKAPIEMDGNSSTSAPSTSFSPSASNPSIPSGPNPALAFAEYQHRFQLYDYAQHAAALRLRLSQSGMGQQGNPPPNPVFGGLGSHPALEAVAAAAAFPLNPFSRFDPRFRFIHEEPKPQHSYIGLIAMAILSNPERKMVLSDIYQYILDNYPYFRNRGPGWRNSIRHNLSLNDCFVKAGRSANGKGHYWAIHPANIDDFRKGDFRRRKAQRKVRKHMGLSVPDDEDSDRSPSPTPGPMPLPPQGLTPQDLGLIQRPGIVPGTGFPFADFPFPFGRNRSIPFRPELLESMNGNVDGSSNKVTRRLFDVESLLAPDSTVVEGQQGSAENKSTSQGNGETLAVEVVTGSSSPRSTNSPGDFVCRASQTDSNCSSPSVSSSGVATPQPRASKNSSSPSLESQPTTRLAPVLTPWHMAQLQSLQHLQQLQNAGLMAHGHNPLSAWAAMSALASSSSPHQPLSSHDNHLIPFAPAAVAFSSSSLETNSNQHPNPNNANTPTTTNLPVQSLLSSRTLSNQK